LPKCIFTPRRRFGSFAQRAGQRGAEEVLMMVGQRRVLRVRHGSREDDRNSHDDSSHARIRR
jgi:hypothetical protein